MSVQSSVKLVLGCSIRGFRITWPLSTFLEPRISLQLCSGSHRMRSTRLGIFLTVLNQTISACSALNDELHDVDPFCSACMIGGNPAISCALLMLPILSTTVFAYAYLLALEPENLLCLCFGMNIYAVALHVAMMSPFVDTVALVSRFLTLRLWGSLQTESSVDDGVWSLGGDLLDTRNCNVGAFGQFNDMFVLLFKQDIVSDPRFCVRFEGCFVKEGNHIMLVAWIMNTIYDLGNVILMAIPGFESCKNLNWCILSSMLSSSPDKTDTRSILLETVYQDGVLYYFYISSLMFPPVFATANSLPYDISILLLTLHRVVHSVLTTRTVLHIREAAFLDQIGQQTSMATVLDF
ncbi:hypothetical protein C8J56DRAFT_881034 [Mycena floridula]|nr:hypothetical protein C8J56DRAFT_881034 [Mycena floridula]